MANRNTHSYDYSRQRCGRDDRLLHPTSMLSGTLSKPGEARQARQGGP